MQRSGAVVIKRGDMDISEAIEGAFINAELARLVKEYKRKADLYDMYMAVQSERYKKKLRELEMIANRPKRLKVIINFFTHAVDRIRY